MSKPGSEFLKTLGAPARSTLENARITSLKRLASYTEKEILALHGMGKTTIPKLKSALKKNGLVFRPQ